MAENYSDHKYIVPLTKNIVSAYCVYVPVYLSMYVYIYILKKII